MGHRASMISFPMTSVSLPLRSYRILDFHLETTIGVFLERHISLPQLFLDAGKWTDCPSKSNRGSFQAFFLKLFKEMISASETSGYSYLFTEWFKKKLNNLERGRTRNVFPNVSGPHTITFLNFPLRFTKRLQNASAKT